MKLYIGFLVKVGAFEVNFKTFEFKLKADHGVFLVHVKPKKIGFVFANTETAYHLAVSFMVAHVGLTYNKV